MTSARYAHARTPVRRAFTLIEVLIVVTLIAILATAVLPGVNLSTERTRETIFVHSMNTFLKAVQLYQTRHQNFPSQAAPGQLPPEFAPYLLPEVFEKDTPLGGRWDIDRDDLDVTFALGVDFGTVLPPLLKLAHIDAVLDDGDLESGRFRSFGTQKFYFVLAE